MSLLFFYSMYFTYLSIIGMCVYIRESDFSSLILTITLTPYKGLSSFSCTILRLTPFLQLYFQSFNSEIYGYIKAVVYEYRSFIISTEFSLEISRS